MRVALSARRWAVGVVVLASGVLAVEMVGPALSTIRADAGAKTPGESELRAILADLHENQRQGMMNVSPIDGELLRILVASGGATRALEIGTSNGYSGIWLGLGLRETGGKLTTVEIDARRASLARENFKRAGLGDVIELIEGDAREQIPELKGPFDFVFIDAWKQDYIKYLEMVYPKLVPGGIITAHNVISHRKDMTDFLEKLKTYPDLKTVIALQEGAGVAVSYKARDWKKR